MAKDTDSFMKELGYPGGGSASKDTGTPAPTTAAGDNEWWFERSGKGQRKATAGLVTGIPRAINAGIGLVSPSLSETLGDLAERIPGVKRMEEFAAEPSESWAETIGGLGVNALTMLGGAPATAVRGAAALPGVFAAGKGFGAPAVTRATAVGGAMPKTVMPPAAVAAPVTLPGKFVGGSSGAQISQLFPQQARGFVPTGPRYIPPPPAPPTWLERAAQTAGRAGMGAATGAAVDPNNPGAGAVAGAVGGVAGPVLGRFVQSSVGRYMAGIGLAGELGYQAYQWLKGQGHSDSVLARAMIDGSLFLLLRGHGSPFRRFLGPGLGNIAQRAAGPLSRSPPGIGGGLGGVAEGAFEYPPEPAEESAEPEPAKEGPAGDAGPSFR